MADKGDDGKGLGSTAGVGKPGMKMLGDVDGMRDFLQSSLKAVADAFATEVKLVGDKLCLKLQHLKS